MKNKFTVAKIQYMVSYYNRCMDYISNILSEDVVESTPGHFTIR